MTRIQAPLLEPNHSTLTGGGLDTLPGRMSMQQRDGGGPPFGSESFHTVPTVADIPTQGMTAAEIVADFPELTTNHVRAALAFAALREHRLATPA